MPALVRSASLTHFSQVAASCGLDARALVAAAGLPSRCLGDPDLKIPARGVARLLEMAAVQARDPAFALRMVESRQLSNLGPLGLLVRDEPTLHSALEALIRHAHVQNEAVAVGVEQNGPLVIVRVELDAGDESARQGIELAVGVAFRVLSVFLGASWQPRLVCFSHRAPPNLAMHQRVFGRAVEFGHEFNGIVCNAADLDAPNPGADPVMARYTRQLLEKRGHAMTMAARVRQLIVLLLPRGHCRVETVAQHLGMDRRTVARRLGAEGVTFSELVDRIRGELTARYLEDGSRPLAEISVLLGFSAPSAFSRWHRHHFGTSPRHLKAARDRAIGGRAGAGR
ncbi:AraC family transcriptional regulator [Ramlibacter tataouinensis]|uniref:AraC family transcriptional regulator n=1 Tax=Ramlibacter tataouinensis TaxID=94132 RepID=A0A127K211_9BURK|nr:AraC family transcriptional regulator [Ramlibacter tataouinensis]